MFHHYGRVKNLNILYNIQLIFLIFDIKLSRVCAHFSTDTQIVLNKETSETLFAIL